jgi:pimeloyl-ACP methyl ester carboxylesterase
VVRLKNAVFGWNGDETSPVHDARWALEQIRGAYPDRPVALVGHSMGGRTALHLADEDGVRVLVGLAPWVHPSDEPRGGAGLRALLLHGDLDRTTDPRASEGMALAMRDRGVDATYRPVRRSGHAMVLRAGLWHEATARFVRDALLGPE